MQINNQWEAETDKFYMRLFQSHTDRDDVMYDNFVVETKQFYTEGRRFQTFYLTQELIKHASEEKVIEVLSKLMQDTINYLIAMGDISES